MSEFKILVPPPKRHQSKWIGLAIGIVVLAVVGTVVVTQPFQGTRYSTNPTGGTAAPIAAPPLTIVSSTPASGAVNVATDAVLTLQLSAPIVGVAGIPSLSPPVAGTWEITGATTVVFAATAPFIPTVTESLVIPAGPSGLLGKSGATLAVATTVSFTIAQASTERLQQLLAEVGYLPLAFTPTAPLSSPVEGFMSQPGALAWRWPTTPPSLSALWSEGGENVITKGAVMNFENQNGMAVDGVAGKQVWSALLAATIAAKSNANPYTYVLVSKTQPETLTLYNNGVVQFANISVNTGVVGADTADGTFPVFEHVTSSRMKGTNPDGTTYDDPDVPWASYFNSGDALHGFPRATYGSPQSNGCVEMAFPDAAKTWPLTPIGTLVTVVGPPP